MKILFIPNDISEELMNYSIEVIESNDLKSIQSDLIEIDENVKLEEVNMGTGADWIMILAIINGITTVFLLGDKIDKGIEGWANIEKRLKKIFSKSRVILIDKDAAIFLAVNYLNEKFRVDSIKLIVESEFTINDLSKMLKDRKSKEFISRPYSVYLMTFEINDNVLYLSELGQTEKLTNIINSTRVIIIRLNKTPRCKKSIICKSVAAGIKNCS